MKPNPPSVSQLEAELRQTRPVAHPPSDLHSSILSVVRSAAESPQPQPALASGRWVIAAMFAALLVFCTWWGFVRPGTADNPFKDAGLALQGTQNIPEQASAAMLAPLSQELDFLNRDFRSAMDFLVASLP